MESTKFSIIQQTEKMEAEKDFFDDDAYYEDYLEEVETEAEKDFFDDDAYYEDYLEQSSK